MNIADSIQVHADETARLGYDGPVILIGANWDDAESYYINKASYDVNEDTLLFSCESFDGKKHDVMLYRATEYTDMHGQKGCYLSYNGIKYSVDGKCGEGIVNVFAKHPNI